MTHYLRSTPSTRKKNRRKGGTGLVYQKLDKENFKSSNKIPNYSRTPRPDPSRSIPSKPMNFAPDATARDSIMERALRGEESEETRNEIIRKSKCLAPAYNKGAAQYVGTTDDAKNLGRK
jgi:hypothetical protein